jgi:hypothetical protein
MTPHKLVKLGTDRLYCLNCRGSWPVSLAHLPYMECVGVYAYRTPDDYAEDLGDALIAAWEKETKRNG